MNKVITFGCRLNNFESEIIKNNLKNTNDDVIIINSCAVTKEAERQVGQAIRRQKRDNPDKKIVVTGCAAQLNPDKYQAMDEVSYVMGNKEKLDINYYNFNSDNKRIMQSESDIEDNTPHLLDSYQDKARAFLQVQNGCNHRCTFCIIPYARGDSRSTPIAVIIEHSKKLVANGYNEIVLTGVDTTSYGEDLPGKPKLGSMITRLLKLVPELKQVRLSSIDVAEIDEELYHLICHEPRFMPHLHLSLQSGDDMILKRMKRRHNRQQVIDFVRDIRSKRPDIVLGADIICGFPTESEEMFENSYKLIEQIEIPFLHPFPYSAREGTPAAKIGNDRQIDKITKKARVKKLQNLANSQLQTLQDREKNNDQIVIIENNNIGRTQHFLKVKLPNKYSDKKIGSIVKIPANETNSEIEFIN